MPPLLRLKLVILVLLSSAAVAGQCRAQVAPGVCELLVISGKHQIIELHKSEYVLTETKIGWDIKILSPETQEAIRSLENPEISFCAGTSEVLARGVDTLTPVVPAGATAIYPVRYGKIAHFTKGVISLMLVGKTARK